MGGTAIPVVYIAYDGGIVTNTTICADMVPAVIGADVDTIKKISHPLQSQGIAVLALNDVSVCTEHKLDGIYFTEISVKDFISVRKQYPNIQMGVFCGNSRHDAMVMGENGADFVVFDDVDCVHWWASMMEVAVVQDMCTENAQVTEHTDFVLKKYI